MYTPSSIVSTLTIGVATFSANNMKMLVDIFYTKFYSVDANGCSSNAQCKQNENGGWKIECKTPSSIVSTLTVAVATLSVNKLK